MVDILTVKMLMVDIMAVKDGSVRFSKSTILAGRLLGGQVRLHRRRKGWTEADAAERAGISRSTLKTIERGGLSVALGSVLEACWVTGVPLFGSDTPGQTAALLDRTQLEVATLPRRIRTSKAKAFDDDF